MKRVSSVFVSHGAPTLLIEGLPARTFLEQAGQSLDFVRWREIIPQAARNHPTPEHLIPLFVAMGAGNDRSSAPIHRSYAYGVLAMDSYVFD